VTTRRRMFCFVGELLSGGSAPTGIGATAAAGVPGTGDYLLALGDIDLDWRVLHVAANAGLGIFAFIVNDHGPIRPTVGTSPQFPNRSLDWYDAFHAGLSWNSVTNTRDGGIWPSEYFGVEHSFLILAHGDPGNVVGGSPAATLDTSYTVKSGSGVARLVPRTADLVGQVLAVTAVTGGTDVDVDTSFAHGITVGQSADVWIGGLGRDTAGAADPQLLGKHSATAQTATRLRITLPSAWTGRAGKLPGGFVFRPSLRVSAIANPRDNLVRLTLNAPVTDAFGQGVVWPSVRNLYVSGITGTPTQVDGRHTYVEQGVSWRPLVRADIAVAASVTINVSAKTITLAAGTWATTPAAGDVVRVTGSLHGDGLHKVASATSTVITLDATTKVFRTETATVRVELLSRSITFAATGKTITLSSGTWERTPTAGETLQVEGSSSNNKTVTVASATSTQITVSETLTNETSSCELYARNEVEWDHGASVTVTGYTSGGWCTTYGLYSAAFIDEAAGEHPLGDAISKAAFCDTAARLAQPNDRLTPELLAFDLGYNDAGVAVGTIEQGVFLASFGDLLQEAVEALRTRLAAQASYPTTAVEVPVALLLFSPSTESSASSPATKYESGHLKLHVLSARAQIQAAASRMTLATVVETADLPRVVGGIYFTADSTLLLGQRLYDALLRLRTVGASITGQRGFPLYFYCGQSQAVGCPNTIFSLDADPDLDGSWYDSAKLTFSGGNFGGAPILRPRGAYMWDPLELDFQEYAPEKNANRYRVDVLTRWGGGAAGTATGGITVGPGVGQAGPEASLLVKLRRRHERVFLYKLALGGAALQQVPGLPTFSPNGADLAQALLDDFASILSWASSRGLVPSTAGFAWDQGEGDLTAPYADSYLSALLEFIDWVRANLDTETSPRAPIPFVIQQVQKHDRMSALWAAGIDAVQTAQQTATTQRDNVVLSSSQGLPIQLDGVHRTFRGFVEAGNRIGDAFDGTTIADDYPADLDGIALNPPLQAGTYENGSPETASAAAAAAANEGSGNAAAAPATAGDATATASSASTDPASLLSAIDAAVQAFLANSALKQYTVDGQTFIRESLGELMRTRALLQQEARQVTGRSANSVFVRGRS